jgi:WD40 repeat protein
MTPQAQDMITAVAFTPDGSRVAAGLFRGQVFFYKTEDLKIETQIVCTKSSTKRKIKYGYKVTALVFRTIAEHRRRKGESESYELLITTNDSRIRLYQVIDLSLTTKFKGQFFVNKSKPIRASFSNHGHHVICGSDTTGVFIWKVPKRRHVENKHEPLKANKKQVESSAGGGGENDNPEEELREKLEALYYSKKYDVYPKYEKFTCEDNFKHLSTTVAIYAPLAAMKEGEAHLTNLTPKSLPVSLSGEQDDEITDFAEPVPFNTVIFNAEINGTIRIIRAMSTNE